MFETLLFFMPFFRQPFVNRIPAPPPSYAYPLHKYRAVEIKPDIDR